ncbi:hypothetical protein Pla110_00250 [Polystyrenella longa]|uniref:Ricin B lectin domain-containing protein n=1 Tax=Polystyrenella longa TaxID=2528007 RepID=A0A518CGM3_9PLAN|nr:RICIN domain-containing protein [Polystyrenella longa]QDU78324.1 hypothetical protein Pla110_00250 [Polystyrenella longa]
MKIRFTLSVLSVALLATFVLQTSPGFAADPIDPNSYYKLTTQWQGDNKALDIINDGQKNNRPVLADKANVSGQLWKITPIRDGYYRLTTSWQGENKALDIVNDSAQNNQPILADKADVSGQFWKLTPIQNNHYRLTTMWQGDGKSLDIINDGKNNTPTLADSGNFTGQFWKLTKVSQNKQNDDAVKGNNVKAVFYKHNNTPGVVMSVGGGKWMEYNADGPNQFREVNRDEWSVYLSDPARQMQIQLDLHRKRVVWIGNSDLYEITNAYK